MDKENKLEKEIDSTKELMLYNLGFGAKYAGLPKKSKGIIAGAYLWTVFSALSLGLLLAADNFKSYKNEHGFLPPIPAGPSAVFDYQNYIPKGIKNH